MSIQIAPPLASSARALPMESAERRLPMDEVVNTITHGVGIPLSLAGAVMLMSAAASTGSPLRIAGCAIYAATLAGVFTASTLSHCFVCPRLRNLFRSVDQALIYLLIAGSYTPLSLTYLHGPIWRFQLVLMWVIAISGFVSKMFYSHRVNSCKIWSYVLLAFIGSIPAFTTIGSVPLAIHGWAFLGGAAFLLGVVFYLLDVKRYHFHAMWHVLVIAGCSCHYAAIYCFVANVV